MTVSSTLVAKACGRQPSATPATAAGKVLFATKVRADAAGAAAFTGEQATKHRRFCSYCLIAFAFSLLAVPPALGGAFDVLRPVQARS